MWCDDAVGINSVVITYKAIEGFIQKLLGNKGSFENDCLFASFIHSNVGKKNDSSDLIKYLN